MYNITERQAQILIFIENFIQENKYSPTVREIAEHFKITAKGAYDHITALEKKNCIICQRRKPRTIQLTGKKKAVGV